MRSHLGVAIFLVACGSKSEPTAIDVVVGSGSSAAAPVDAAIPELCELGTQALAALTTCNGKSVEKEMVRARQTYAGVTASLKTQSADNREIGCAQVLYAMDRQIAAVGCAIPLSAAARARMYDRVEEWRARRTPVVATGNAAADAVVKKVATLRDAACACKDAACLDAIAARLGELGAFADDAPDAARKLGEALLDDIGRCKANITDPVKRQ